MLQKQFLRGVHSNKRLSRGRLQNIFKKYFNEFLSFLFSLNLCVYSCVQTPKKASLLIFIEAFMLVDQKHWKLDL